MAEIRCPNGHLYENKRHSNCPYCPIQGLDTGTDTSKSGSAAAARYPQGPVQPDRDDTATRASPTSGGHPTTVIRWNRARANSGGVADSANKNPLGGTTSGAGDTAPDRDPVVGWLVAVDGPAQGRDFRVRAGHNTIGRDASRHIFIPDDPQIHRDTNAILTYDPLTNAYYLQAGTVRGLTYVSDPANPDTWVPVLQAVKLDPYQLVRIGGTRFTFVPLCGEFFRWDLS